MNAYKEADTASAAELIEPIRAEIDHWIAKYPPENKRSAVMAALHAAQKQYGWLSEPLMNAVADYLAMPKTVVYEVATFYAMYDLNPVGQHKISVCNSISCMLNGSDELIHYLENRLGVKVGETTADGKFTLKEAECLAACGGAPACQVGLTYHERMTPEAMEKILSELEGMHHG